VAAKNFGRLRRAWPEAVFLSRRMAQELSVPFSQEAGTEEYLDELVEVSHEAEHAVEDMFYARTVALTSPFRAPSFVPAHRPAQDAARISSRALLPTAWCSGVMRAPRHLDLSRWFPRYPRWWFNRGMGMEMPYALSNLAHKLIDEFSAAWHVVNAEYYSFLAAGWVQTLMTDKVFAWLEATALRRMSKLDLHLMASGPGGRAMFDTFHIMHKVHGGLPVHHRRQGRHSTGHADACGASGARPFGLVGRVRVHVELPLSGLCVTSRLRRRLGRRWRDASGGGSRKWRFRPSRDAVGLWAFASGRFSQPSGFAVACARDRRCLRVRGT